MPDLLDPPVSTPKKARPKPKADPKPAPDNRKPMVVQVRGSDEWKTWMEELAAVEGDTIAKFVERLARKHAREIGFREMPKR